MRARDLVGRNIRRLRLARQLPQEELGVAAGIEPSYVGRIERGRENVTLDLLEALATALDVDVGAFFTQPGGELLPGLRAGRKPKVSTVSALLPTVHELPAATEAVPEAPSTASAPPGGDEGVEGA